MVGRAPPPDLTPGQGGCAGGLPVRPNFDCVFNDMFDDHVSIETPLERKPSRFTRHVLEEEIRDSS
eukprot:742632-Prorocentrum_minimum.AAC.3